MIYDNGIIDCGDTMTNNLDLNLLIMLEHLWLTRSVSRTAEHMHLAQSSVSAALARLRLQVGDQLFKWDGSEMKPTAFTISLMPELMTTLQKLRVLLDRGDLGRMRRHFVILAYEAVTAELAPQLFERALQEDLDFEFSFSRPQTDWHHYRPSETVDALVLPVEVIPRSFESMPLWTDDFIVIAAATNTRAKSGITEEELLDLTHIGLSISLPRGSTYSPDDWRHGAMQAPKLTVTSYSLLAEIVAQSSAVALLPRRVGERAAQKLPLKCIEPPTSVAPMKMMLAWDKARAADPAHRWLLQAITSSLSGNASV